MKILMIDRNGFVSQTRKVLIEESIEADVEVVTTLGETYIAFQKDLFTVVILDHAIENGQQCLDHIVQLDPTQKIIIVSDAIHCVVNRCEDCVNQYQIRRLFNPTPIHNIIRMIEGFGHYECDHYDKETNKIKV